MFEAAFGEAFESALGRRPQAQKRKPSLLASAEGKLRARKLSTTVA